MKKLFITIIVMLLPMLANADPIEIDGIWYNLVSTVKTAEVTNMPTGSYSGAIEIPDKVTCEGLEYSVISIGYCAFTDCSGLTSIGIPNSVTLIDSYAFKDCSGLTSVTIPNSVTSIGWEVFYGCSGLTSITIPNSVTSIGRDAFDGTEWYNNQPDGLVYAGKVAYKYKGTMPNNTSIIIQDGTLEVTDLAFSNCSGLTSVSIPNSLTSIGSSAFSGCSGLVSITIPNSVTSIGDEAFKDCSSLTSVTIPSSVTSIGFGAFDGTGWYNNQPDGLVYAGKVAYKYKGTMPNNTSITIKDGTVEISSNAFYNCSGLTSVTIPNSVMSIGSLAFCKCSGLTSVTIPNSVTSIGFGAFEYCIGLTSITIPNSVTNIEMNVFLGCSGLTSVTIPSSVTSIGDWAFSFCSALTSVTIPNNVTSIGYSAFSDCSSLNSVIIPNSVTSIGDSSFSGCSELFNIYCYAEKVPQAGESTFLGLKWYATIHVPMISYLLYKNTSPWSRFLITGLTEDDPKPTSFHVLKNDYQIKPVGAYSLDGKFISEPRRGLNIIKMNNGSAKKVIVK